MRNKAFTLAEVLITLGIIGVVAAMTLPMIIQNYNKKIVTTRLQVAQSVISQMLNFAIADYGDPKYWDYADVYGQSAGDSTRKNLIVKTTEKYFLPYLSDLKSSGYKTLNEAGYPLYHNAYGAVDTNNLNSLNKYHYVIEFANGMTIFVYVNSSTLNGGIYTNILMYVDVNGKKGPNVFGRDTFYAQIISDSGLFKWFYQGAKRADLIDICKRNLFSCGALIMNDGWEIKDDYPIKI